MSLPDVYDSSQDHRITDEVRERAAGYEAKWAKENRLAILEALRTFDKDEIQEIADKVAEVATRRETHRSTL
jgi:uncharacterized protein CbrC (UPF0167 family)